MKQIIITIADGRAVVETKGFAGSECQRETRELERRLFGDAAVHEELTAEYFKAPAVMGQKVGGGRG